MSFGGKDSMAEFMGARVISFNYFFFPEFSLFVGEQNTEQSALHNEGITTTVTGGVSTIFSG
jgi:hypothetical protein